jgi:hypothetical protein
MYYQEVTGRWCYSDDEKWETKWEKIEVSSEEEGL